MRRSPRGSRTRRGPAEPRNPSAPGARDIHFCPRCGIHTHTRPRAAPELYTVNVRVLDDFDLERESPEVVEFDGRHWERSVGQLR